MVREVEEHRGPGCYDGLLARALATQHADAFAVVPQAFAVAAPYVVNGTAPCGCRPGVENQPPTKTMRRSVRDYDAYLVRAVGARGDPRVTPAAVDAPVGAPRVRAPAARGR